MVCWCVWVHHDAGFLSRESCGCFSWRIRAAEQQLSEGAEQSHDKVGKKQHGYQAIMITCKQWNEKGVAAIYAGAAG